MGQLVAAKKACKNRKKQSNS